MKKVYTFSLIFLFVSTANINAQKNTFEIGVKVTSEYASGINDGNGIGFQVLHNFFGIGRFESGIIYKANTKKYLAPLAINPQTRPILQPFSQTERTISIPIAYRIETRFINISAGSGLHFLINSKLLDMSMMEKPEWEETKIQAIGSIALSKDFRLNKTLYVEPEVKLCSYSHNGGNGFQLNLSFRKRFEL